MKSMTSNRSRTRAPSTALDAALDHGKEHRTMISGALSDRRERFRTLHAEGLFIMPNPWDIGSARLLASLGFEALATTSSGHASSLGQFDYGVGREHMLTHVKALATAVD